MSRRLPRYDSRFLDPSGRVTREWRDYLRTLEPAEASDTIRRELARLQKQVDELEQGAAPEIHNVLGRNSVETFGLLPTGDVFVQLRGDQGSPGPSLYYGTNDAGERGFHPLPEPSTGGGILPMVNGETPPVLMYGGNQLIYARVE